MFFARLNVLAVQTGVQFQPLHMNAPQRFRVGSLSSLSPCASGSGKTKPPVILTVAGALRNTLYGRGMKGSKDVTPKETSADIAATWQSAFSLHLPLKSISLHRRKPSNTSFLKAICFDLRDFRVSQSDTKTERGGKWFKTFGVWTYTRGGLHVFSWRAVRCVSATTERQETGEKWRKKKGGVIQKKKKNGREEKGKKRSGRCREGRGEGRRTGEVCSAGGLGEENHRKDRGREGEWERSRKTGRESERGVEKRGGRGRIRAPWRQRFPVRGGNDTVCVCVCVCYTRGGVHSVCVSVQFHMWLCDFSFSVCFYSNPSFMSEMCSYVSAVCV